MKSAGLTPLQEIKELFKEIPDLPMEDGEGPKRGASEGPEQKKYARPSSKGLGNGKGPMAEPAEKETESQDPQAARGSEEPPAPKDRNNARSAKSWDKELSWDGWRQDDQDWGRYQGYDSRRMDDLEEKMRLIARVALRHEDELSQMRTERVFVLTFETKVGSVLNRLFELAMKWHEKKEKQEVDSPLRLILFMGLLEHWKIRLRALEADESMSKQMVEKGLATVKEGLPELLWGYQRWNPNLEQLENVPEVEPMLQSQVVETLIQLEATIAAPNALLQFHATRKLVETLEGDTITFLMGVGLRDPMASQAWGMMTNLCGLSAGRLIGLRIRPARMERQPIAKVLAEKFPPPRARERERAEAVVGANHNEADSKARHPLWPSAH